MTTAPRLDGPSVPVTDEEYTRLRQILHNPQLLSYPAFMRAMGQRQGARANTEPGSAVAPGKPATPAAIRPRYQPPVQPAPVAPLASYLSSLT